MTVAGVLALVVAAVALLARFIPINNVVVFAIVAWSPYLMLGAIVAAVLFGLSRRWVLAAIACALTVAVVAVQIPSVTGSADEPANAVNLRVMPINLALGFADAGVVVALARQHADVVVVQELTPNAAYLLSVAGMDTAFPYHLLDAKDQSAGVGMWSRYPLTPTRVTGDGELSMVVGRLSPPGVAIAPKVGAVRVPNPLSSSTAAWRDSLSRLETRLGRLAESAGDSCVIVAGDFNSTVDMREFRALLRDGYSDSHMQTGARTATTYPSFWSMIPAALIIDHVLTRNCTATSVRTVRLPISDHRALVADIKVPRQP